MIEKDPSSFEWFTYAWVVFVAMWGGVVAFLRKVNSGSVRPFNLTELLGEVFTSGFAGVITFWLCESAGVDKLLSAALVGISGHMGNRAIFLFELYIAEWLRIRSDAKFPKD